MSSNRFMNIERIAKAGFLNFWRNTWVTLATILVFVITIFTIGSVLFARTLLDFSLEKIERKVDVTVYFKTDAPEREMLALKESLEELPEVAGVEYVSREQALEDFKARHSNNALITQSLAELGENPLGASLNIRAADITQYERVAAFLQSATGVGDPTSVVDKVNFFQNKLVIERLSRIVEIANRVGLVSSIILAALAILVAFNTIRLAIYTAREEIAVMRLVGANDTFISGPFVVEGVMYGVVSALITMAIFYPVLICAGPLTESFFGGFNLLDYYISHLARFLALFLLIGIALGGLSSLIAIRRYLRV